MKRRIFLMTMSRQVRGVKSVVECQRCYYVSLNQILHVTINDLQNIGFLKRRSSWTMLCILSTEGKIISSA